MSVAVKSASPFALGLPAPLFGLSVAELAPQFGRDFAVSHDGQRFLVNWVPDERASATIVVNWTAPLKSLGPQSAPSRCGRFSRRIQPRKRFCESRRPFEASGLFATMR